MILVVDGAVRQHLARAVAAHLQWCRRSAIAAPPELSELLSTLADPSGHERPNMQGDAAIRDSQLVGYGTAARLIDVSERTVRRMTTDGRLRTVRVGRRRLILVDDLREIAHGA